MRFAYEYIKRIIETTSLDAPVISVAVAGGKTTIEVIELQHIAVGRVVAIDGVKYLVESVNYDDSTFTVSGEILEPKIITYPEINFVHGTAAMVNAEIQARKAVGNKANLNEKQRYPLLWMVEIYSQKTGGKADNFDIESDIKLVLLDDVKSNKLTTDQHYTNVINGQKQLWDWLLSIFTKHKTIVKNENFDISNDIRETAHTNFGRFQNDKGHTTHILDENISGLEIELSNVRFKLNQCKQLFETQRCVPVIIYQNIMAGGIQKVNLLSDLNSKSVDDSVYFVIEKGRFYVGTPDGSSYAIDDDYTTASSDAAPAAWVWIDIASKSNGFFIADSVLIRNALPENLRRKGHVCSLFTVDKYVLYTYQGTNSAQVNWSNDANWTLLEGGSTSWDDITDKPAGLVVDEDYVHTDNNFTDTDKGLVLTVAGLATVALTGSHTDLANQNSDANFQHITQTFKDGLLSTSNVTVTDISEGEQKILAVKKQNGLPVVGDAIKQIPKMVAASTFDALLADSAGWVNGILTFSAVSNNNGEYGIEGQEHVIGQNFYLCKTSSATGATWVRNLSDDCLKTSSTQDNTIINILKNTATWTNNETIITTRSRRGSWYHEVGGYHYFCFDEVGSNWYWSRTGTPSTTTLQIGDTTLIAELQANDWVTNPTLVPVATEKGQQGQELCYLSGSQPIMLRCGLFASTLRWYVVTDQSRTVKITLTNAQIKALATTAISLISAPAGGFLTIIEGVALSYIVGTNESFTVAADSDLSIRYAGGFEIVRFETTGFLDQTTSQIAHDRRIAIMNSRANLSAKAIEISNVGTQISGNASNNNTIAVYITLKTIKL